jgi:hypothetical protein
MKPNVKKLLLSDGKESQQKNKLVNGWLLLIFLSKWGNNLLVFLPRQLDENHPSPKVYYNKILVMVGVFLALYNVHRQVNEINKSQ